MTPEQRELVRESFEKVVPLTPAFGRMFYERLFEIDPSVKTLFKGDLDRQASMLGEALTYAVLQLIAQGTVSQVIRDMGRRHAGYGVQSSQYQSFGAALRWTFEQRRGEAFTPDVREAWSEAWAMLTRAMLEAASESASESAS